MEEKRLAKILRLCLKYGVDSFECDGIRIKFKENISYVIPRSVTSKVKKEMKKEEEVEDLREQLSFADELVSTMHLEDPLAFEESLVRGDLGSEAVRN